MVFRQDLPWRGHRHGTKHVLRSLNSPRGQ